MHVGGVGVAAVYQLDAEAGNASMMFACVTIDFDKIAVVLFRLATL